MAVRVQDLVKDPKFWTLSPEAKEKVVEKVGAQDQEWLGLSPQARTIAAQKIAVKTAGTPPTQPTIQPTTPRPTESVPPTEPGPLASLPPVQAAGAAVPFAEAAPLTDQREPGDTRLTLEQIELRKAAEERSEKHPYLAAFQRGVADMAQASGGAERLLGMPGAERGEEMGAVVREGAPDVEGAGVGWVKEVLELLPTSTALAATAAPGMTAAAGSLPAFLVAALLQRGGEGIIEGGEQMSRALAEGASYDEARKRGLKVAAMNLPLAAMDAGEFATAFLPMAKWSKPVLKALGKVKLSPEVRNRLLSVPARTAQAILTEAAGLLGTAVQEGEEERIQEWIHQKVAGVDTGLPEAKEERKEAAGKGRLLGAVLGAAGTPVRVAQRILGREPKKLAEEEGKLEPLPREMFEPEKAETRRPAEKPLQKPPEPAEPPPSPAPQEPPVAQSAQGQEPEAAPSEEKPPAKPKPETTPEQERRVDDFLRSLQGEPATQEMLDYYRDQAAELGIEKDERVQRALKAFDEKREKLRDYEEEPYEPEIGERVVYLDDQGEELSGWVKEFDDGNVKLKVLGKKGQVTAPVSRIRPYEKPERAGRLPFGEKEAPSAEGVRGDEGQVPPGGDVGEGREGEGREDLQQPPSEQPGGAAPQAEEAGEGREEGAEPKEEEDAVGRVIERTRELIRNAHAAGQKLSALEIAAQAKKELGSQAEKGYTSKDVYDLTEAAMNKLFLSEEYAGNLDPSQDTVHLKRLNEIEKIVPSQTRRTDEQIARQQFSTPPSYAYVINWLANTRKGETVLEPSAGTGNIAVFAKNAGARVIANEIDEKRLDLLKRTGVADQTYQLDAGQIDATLHGKVSPDVVVMNPPFSKAEMKRTGSRKGQAGADHIEAAFRLLKPGGRLVAIVGGGLGETGTGRQSWGMALDAPSYKDFWKRLRDRGADIRANVRVSGDVYKRYGTSFATRVLVIDKPVGEPSAAEPITGEVANLEELTDILSEVRNDRPEAVPAPRKPRSDQRDEEAGAGGVEPSRADTGVEPTPRGTVGREDTGAEAGVSPVAPGGVPPRVPAEPGGAAEAAGERPGAEQPTEAAGAGGVAPGESPREAGERGPSAAETPRRVAARTGERGPAVKAQSDKTFVDYSPSIKVRGGQEHGAPLAESFTMAAVEPPAVDVKLNLPQDVIDSGAYSGVQLESIALAVAAQDRHTADGRRMGFFTGDGTGVGKTRQILGVIHHYTREGKKRHIIMSPREDLMHDMRSEAEAVEFPLDIVDLKKTPTKQDINMKDGVLFVTYGTLASQSAERRLQQILEWVGDDFDGVMAIDEAHVLGNLLDQQGRVGGKGTSARAKKVNEIQNRLPEARVFYASATGATEIENLAYASRLGLWGEGTPFATPGAFVGRIDKGGLSAMELVAQDLKARGLYISRNLSFEGVEVADQAETTAVLTPQQIEMYNKAAEAWRTVVSAVEGTLSEKYGNLRSPQEARWARSQLYGAMQRFWNETLTAFMAPRIIEEIKKDLAAGLAPVLQMEHHYGGRLEEAIAQLENRNDPDELAALDITPRGTIINYIRSFFPTARVAEDEKGNIVEVREDPKDPKSKVVEDPELVEKRDALIESIADFTIPKPLIDQVLGEFGANKVAEVTTRQLRIIKDPKTGRLKVHKRGTKAPRAEAAEFQRGKRDILIFTRAGGTGSSYHADLSTKNHKRRAHYLVEPGWVASNAVQGLGRTHRTNQAAPPLVKLFTTNIPGHKRFISTIARRLTQLGALTKGSKDASGQSVFTEADNLETKLAGEALQQYLKAIQGAYDAKERFGVTWDEIVQQFALKTDRRGRADPAQVDVKMFLNRILNMRPDVQEPFFNGFMDRYSTMIEQAKEAGNWNVGTETYKADSITIDSEQDAYMDPASGAKVRYVKMTAQHRTRPFTFEHLSDTASLKPIKDTEGNSYEWIQNIHSGRVYRVTTHLSDPHKLRLFGPKGYRSEMRWDVLQYVEGRVAYASQKPKWRELTSDQARKLYEEELEQLPEFTEEDVHAFEGALLPVMDRFEGIELRVFNTDKRRVIGARVEESDLEKTLENFGIGLETEVPPPAVMLRKILENNYTAKLSNEWTLKRSKVSGEDRIELLPRPGYPFGQGETNMLQNQGAFSEIINNKRRVFIPTGSAGAAVLERILQGKQVTRWDSPSRRGIREQEDELYLPAPANSNPISPHYDPSHLPVRLKNPRGEQKTTTAPKVIEALSTAAQAFGVRAPLRTGRTGSRRRAGVFKTGPEVIRIATANDIPTAAHEFAHAIEKAVFGFPRGGPWQRPTATKAMQDELVKLGKDIYGTSKPKGGYKREGFAGFMHLWVVDPAQAEKRAPNFSKWFDGQFLPAHADGRAALERAREEARTWMEQGAQARAKRSVIDTGSAPERLKRIGGRLKKITSPQTTYEMLHPLYKLALEAEELLGRKLKPSENPYIVASALRKVHGGRVKYMVERGMIDIAGNVTGAPLSDIHGIVKGKETEFTIYLWARRARALWLDPEAPQGRNPGLSLEDANTIIDELETPEFQIAASKVYRWNEGVLLYAAQASPHFAQIVQRVANRDPGFYIPLQRHFDELNEAYRGIRGARGSGGRIVARLKGSGRQIKNPFPEMIAQAYRTVRAAHTDIVLETMFNLSEIEGIGSFVEEVPRDQVPVYQGEVRDIIDKISKQLAPLGSAEVQGIDPFDLLGETITFFMPAKLPKGKDPIVARWREGRLRWYQVDGELYHMLETMEPYRLPWMLELVAGKPASIARAGYTGLRAAFGLVTNPLRDPQTGMLNTQVHGKLGLLLAAWLQAFGSGFRYRVQGETKNPYMEAFIRWGGEMAQPLAQDVNYTRRTARRLFQNRVEVTLDPRNWFDFYRDFVQFPEFAPRVAEIKGLAKDHGIDINKPLTLDNSLFLLLAAKQVTTDFTSEGEASRVMNRIVPFFNAAIQGPRANLRALQRNPSQFLARGLALTGITVGLWLAHKDEDWWREMPFREKFLYWHFPTDWPEPTLVRIPRAFEVGMIFSALPEAMLDAWYHNDPEAAEEWARTTFDVANPGFMPVLMEEALEQAANWDFFWKRAIVSEGEKRKPAEEQFNEYTSKVSILLGDMFNVSPKRLDHAIYGIGGPVSMDLISLLGLGPKGIDRQSEAADTVLIGRVFQRGGKLGPRQRSIEKLYEELEKAERRSYSTKLEETEEQRQRRLLLTDAARAISALGYVKMYVRTTEDREKIQRQRLQIARDALEAAGSDAARFLRKPFQTERKVAEKVKEATKAAVGQ